MKKVRVLPEPGIDPPDDESVMTIDKRGTREWWNSRDELHRRGGPAIIGADGTEEWLINGYYHRDDGPAITYPDGRAEWYRNGKDVTKIELLRLARDGDKATVLKQMLVPIKKHNDFKPAMALIRSLRKAGIDWPEFKMIESSMESPRLDEGVISSKRQLIKSQGVVVYDGDPREYEWRAKSIQLMFDGVEEVLRKVGRRFDRLLIVSGGTAYRERWFLATSHGSPEVIFYFYYNAGGMQSFVYVDHLRHKTQEYLGLPMDEKVEMISDAKAPAPDEIWRRERSVDTIGSALRNMDQAAADAAMVKLGPKLLAAIGKMDPKDGDIKKLAIFIDHLIKIGTKESARLAQAAMDTYKHAMIKRLLQKIKESGVTSVAARINLMFLSKHFDWPELDVIRKSLDREAPR